jgi:trk system potassium uptake protein TrkH
VWAYVRSIFSREEDVVLMKHAIPPQLINQAFFVMFLSLAVIFMGALFLSVTESKKFIRILFETVSAFGTVGLSTGITPELSPPGKIVIAALMFIGRLGPLTIVTAFARKHKYMEIKYPVGKINIG